MRPPRRSGRRSPTSIAAVRPRSLVSRIARSDAARPALDVMAATAAGFAIGAEAPALAAYAVIAPLAIMSVGAYGVPPFGASARIRTALRLWLAATVAGWAYTLIAGVQGPPAPVGEVALLWLLTVAGWSVTRVALGRLATRAPERVIVLGSGEIALRLETLVSRFGEGRMDLVGFIDGTPAGDHSDYSLPWLGDPAELHALLERHGIDRVIVAFSASPDARTMEMVRDCDSHGVQVDVVPRLFDLVSTHSGSYSLGGLPIVSIAPRIPRPLQRLAKRSLDIVVAGLLLVLTLPLQAVVALLIVLEDRGPAVYRQLRIGRDGKPFSILKFRTMRVASEAEDLPWIDAVRSGDLPISGAVEGIKLARDPRVTRIGAVLRRTSLDELPQLWNVLRGEMSLVGPRPLRPFEVETLASWERTRMLERPGMTGLWQVTGRSEMEWAERMQLDYSYVRHWSLSRDLEILARTVRTVLDGNGAR